MSLGFYGLLEQLQEAFALCRSLGLDPTPRGGRFEDCERRVEYLAEANARQANGCVNAEAFLRAVTSEDGEHFMAVTEATEFSDVRLLADCDRDALRKKLKIVLSGPILRIHETEKNNQPRSIQYELSLAATMKGAGLEVNLGEYPDVTCKIGQTVLGFACTRPLAERNIGERIREAGKRLARDLKDYRRVPATARGVIAVSLSRVLNPGGRFFRFGSDHGAGVHRLQEDTFAAGKPHLSVCKTLHDRIIGITFESIMPTLAPNGTHNVAHVIAPVSLARRRSPDERLFEQYLAALGTRARRSALA